MSTVGFKWLNTYWRRRYRARPSLTADVYCSCYWCTSVCHHHQARGGKNCSNTISSVAESRLLMTGMGPGRPVVLSTIPFRHTRTHTCQLAHQAGVFLYQRVDWYTKPWQVNHYVWYRNTETVKYLGISAGSTVYCYHTVLYYQKINIVIEISLRFVVPSVLVHLLHLLGIRNDGLSTL